MKKTIATSTLLLAIATLSAIGENSSLVIRNSSLSGGDEAAAQWSVLPVFGGGYVQNVAIAPSNPSRWYAYVDVGGPYRSDDGGRSWTPLHALMTVAQRAVWGDHVRALSVDPRNADRFVMAAGDSFSTMAGVYVTTDGGRTFRRTLKAKFYGDGNTRWMGQCMARHPTNPNILYCGEDWDGIYRSNDNGETWTNLGLTEMLITDIRIDPNNPSTIYVCAPGLKPGRQDPNANTRTRGKGFFRSTDGGATWTTLSSTNSPTETAQIAGSSRIVGLFANRHVRASDDGGATWYAFETGLTIASDSASEPSFTDTKRFQSIAAGPDFWLVGNGRGDIYRRGKNDTTWRKVTRVSVSLGDPVAEHHQADRAANGQFWALGTIIIDPRDRNHWLATDWYAIWETLDAGRTWTSRVNGMSQLVPFTLACDPHSSTNILYGFADLGLSISHDGGRSFHAEAAKLAYANSISWSALTPGLAYCVGGKSGVPFRRTRDGGRTWQTPAKSGLPAFRGGNPVVSTNEIAAYTVAVDPTTDEVYLCLSGPSGPNGGGVWKSGDQGDSFTRFSGGLPEGINLFRASEFECGGDYGYHPQLVFSPDGSAILTTYNGECYTMERGGDAPGWVPTTTITNQPGWRTIAADPFTPGRFLSPQVASLMESTDGGRTWHDLITTTSGSGWLSSGSVAFDAHAPGLVVSASKNAISVSVDGGRTFSPLDGGLDYPTGVKRYVAVDRGRLFGLTRGSGVWMRQLPPTVALSVTVTPGFDWTNGTATVTAVAAAPESVPAGSKIRLTVLGADGAVLGTAEQDWTGSGEYSFDTAAAMPGDVLGGGINYTLSFSVFDTNGVEIVGGPLPSPLRLGSAAAWFSADPATGAVSGGAWVGGTAPAVKAGLYDLGEDGAAFAALQDCTGSLARAEIMFYGSGYASTNALATNLQYAIANGSRAGLAAVAAGGFDVILHGLVDENGATVWRPLEDCVTLPFEGDFVQAALELDTASAQPLVSYLVCRDGEWTRLHDATGREWFAAPGSGARIAGRVDFQGKRVGGFAGYTIDKAVAEVNGVRYDSIADALRAAGRGGTVTLLTNVVAPATLTAGRAIVNNGHLFVTYNDFVFTTFSIQ